MIKEFKNNNTLTKIINGSLIDLPAPVNISVIWNFGVILLIILGVQIITGILLASNYIPSNPSSFFFLSKYIESSENSWIIRYTHANGASFYFIFIYLHIARGLYYNSFIIKHTWIIGVTILLISIAAAFIGYVLPLRQISYWGASVITNLFSEIPYLGPDIVKTIWGGPLIDTPTITRFFAFHFLIPFIILGLVIIHITFLHETGSSNPLGINSSHSKVFFRPYFLTKDFYIIIIFMIIFIFLIFLKPLILGDDENFVSSNPLSTPIHIQPEWYFLFAYAILRRVPNKLGGVVALALSVILYYSLPITHNSKIKTRNFLPLDKILFWFFLINIILLSWIGARPVEPPYILTGQILSIRYFIYFLIKPFTFQIWLKIKA